MKYTIAIILATLLVGCGESSSSDSSSGGGGSGKGGSMARFAIAGDYLYTLNNREIAKFYIGNPASPRPESKTRNVNFDVETLFSHGNYLYVGAMTGMYIYDADLEFISSFTHIKSCDPVVVQDGLAFVTLDASSSCQQSAGKNALQVLDVNDTRNIRKIYEDTTMWGPKGLGIDGDKLFVCDDRAGLKVYNVQKIDANETAGTKVDVNITLMDTNTIGDVNCYDVIPYKYNLIVSDGDRVRQFDYSKFPMEEWGEIK
ncbi:MAG TPA: hypothetical protein EYH01_04850 [Campylobacterales bacterium]|nr:hypothetical protein [Campylobacterales bacterium]